MMAVMTAQPPLPLVPEDARPVGAAAAIIEDDDGGRVFVHGNLAYAWDAGDCAARRFAAVSLLRIKAATQLEVAEAFGVKPASVRRWDDAARRRGRCRAVRANAKAPNASRSSPARWSPPSAACARAGRRIAPSPPLPGCRQGSVGNALGPVDADTDTDTGERCTPTGSDATPAAGAGDRSRSREAETRCCAEQDGFPMPCPRPVRWPWAGRLPVLADPAPRGAERVLARFGLIAAAPPVFTPCARAPLAGLLLALPALAGDRAARGSRTPPTAGSRTGSTRWIRCCARACSAPCWARPAPRAPRGSTRSRWAGRWGWTGHRR